MTPGRRSSRSAPRRVVVVGAGLSGLSAALHLAGRGCAVTVLEREPSPGGRAARVEREGSCGRYVLDTGPTVLTMPDMLRDCFDAVGSRLDDHLDLRAVDPAYQARFADGSVLDVGTDTAEMADRIAAFAGAADAGGYLRYVAHLRELYAVQIRTFIDRNLDSPLSLARPALARLVALGGFRRLDPLLSQYFRDERLRRVFGFGALYAGVSPMRALALYAVISYMDLVGGVCYPVGGMHAVPAALAAAAVGAGVEVCYDTAVCGIDDAATTIVRSADGRSWAADAVVLTTEVSRARELLAGFGGGRRGRRLAGSRIEYSPSCVVLAAGMRRSWPGAAHHTICFGRPWAPVFDDLAAGRAMRHPSFLVSLPSRADASLAPPGGASVHVLFPAPNLLDGPDLDWRRLAPTYREHMLAQVEHRAALPGFADAIEVEELVTPADWAARGYDSGTPFSAAHTFAQTGPLRTPNRIAPGVVLAGCGTVPGVGIPTALISGRLAAERLLGRDSSYRSRAWP